MYGVESCSQMIFKHKSVDYKLKERNIDVKLIDIKIFLCSMKFKKNNTNILKRKITSVLTIFRH